MADEIYQSPQTGSTNKVRIVRPKGEKDFPPSITKPGESFSIKELYGRAIRGQDIQMMKRAGIYDNDEGYNELIGDLRRPENDFADTERILKHARRTIELVEERMEQTGDINPDNTPMNPPEPEPEPEEET